MFRPKAAEPQVTLRIATSELPATPVHSFYEQLDRALTQAGFGDTVRALCAPFYETDARRGGRPGIDPEVYFKMQMIGFFENLASERAIAARCADSLAIRAFLHYALTERTPDHTTLTVIRQRGLGGFPRGAGHDAAVLFHQTRDVLRATISPMAALGRPARLTHRPSVAMRSFLNKTPRHHQ